MKCNAVAAPPDFEGLNFLSENYNRNVVVTTGGNTGELRVFMTGEDAFLLLAIRCIYQMKLLLLELFYVIIISEIKILFLACLIT